MKKFVKYILVALALTAALPEAAAKDAQVYTPAIYDVNVAINDADNTLDVSVELPLASFKPGNDGEYIFTPVIVSADGQETLALEPATVCGRNRYIRYMRAGALNDKDAPIYRSGKHNVARLRQTVPFEEWMNGATVELRCEAASCCKTPDPVPGTSTWGYTELAKIDTSRPDVVAEFVFAPPVDDAPVEKAIEGRAFVTFVVNRTELKDDYLKNPEELAKILRSVQYVLDDTDAVITGVHIKGYASPEGPYANNVRLATGRTITLSNYVHSKAPFLPDSIFTTAFEPEDWEGLRTYITDSLDFNIVHRPEILEIIDTFMDPDAKNDLIQRRYPADYKVIHKEIYPWLRHSDYTVKYRIKVYTDIENLKRLYASDPTRLRPVDFYTLAAEHQPGSKEYNDIMSTAVIVYPEDMMLNLNAANIAMMTNDLDAARSYLTKAGNSPEAIYARGVLAGRQNRLDEALEYFNEAKRLGVAEADNAIESVAAVKAMKSVKVTCETQKDNKK